MKKTKFAVLLTAFMAVLGLSSCLGEPDPYYTGTEIMKVNNFMGFYSFKSSYGYTVEPTNSNIITSTIDAKFAWVTYKYDTRTANPDSETLDAEIQYLIPISEIEPGYGELTPNAAMYTTSETVKFYDKTNIFIDLSYYYEYSSDSDDLKEEIAKHSFYLTKATAEEDEDVTDNTVVLNLIHLVTDADNNEDREKIGTETRHFDLSYVLQGTEPEKIIIKFKQNTSSIDVDDDTKDGEIEIEYKKIVDSYFSGSGSNI